MDPRDVKLPLLIRLKVLKKACDDNDGIYSALIGIVLFYTPGVLLALNVPSFMLGPISNFVVTFLFSLIFAGILLGIVIAAYKSYEEDLYPLFHKIKRSYDEKALPFQKAEMEKVDDILLDNK